jgi:hypothetical protein
MRFAGTSLVDLLLTSLGKSVSAGLEGGLASFGGVQVTKEGNAKQNSSGVRLARRRRRGSSRDESTI